MTGATVLTRAPNLAARLFEERMLIVTPANGMLHRFNEVGTFIWEFLEQPRRAGEIVDAVAARFDGFDKKRNRGEVEAFLEAMLGKGLVRSEEIP